MASTGRSMNLALLSASAFILSSCLLGTSSKGSGTADEARVGVIYSSDAKPVANARVRVFSVAHVPEEASGGAGAAFATQTDKSGAFRVGELPAGEYNIIADADGQYAMQDSIWLDGNTGGIPADTLTEPGTLSGIVRLQPNHDPRMAIAQVMGTHLYSNVDSTGRFRIPSLAGGRYTLRIFSSQGDYVALFRSITIGEGEETVVSDTLIPPFLGIPAVLGLKAVFDTLNSVVTLTWKKAEYRDFSEYQVYRDTSPSLELSKRPVAAIQDTVFQDSLEEVLGGMPASSGASALAFEYRIRIRSKADATGPAYGHFRIPTPPAGLVRTEIGLKVSKIEWDTARQADSVEIAVSLRNATRKLQRMTWAVGSRQDVFDSISLGGVSSWERTLRFGHEKEGPYPVYVQVEDDAGTVWTDSIKLDGNSTPRMSGAADSVGKAYIAYRFAPRVTDEDKDTLLFTIVNRPKWCDFDSLTGVLSGVPANADTGVYSGISIAATDGRRTVRTASFSIEIEPNPWSPAPEFPGEQRRSIMVSFGGRIYIIQEHGDIWMLDPVLEKWTKEGKSLFGNFFPFAIGDKIIQFGHVGISSVIYDPALKTFTSKSNPAYDGPMITTGAVVDGRFYCPTHFFRRLHAYDIATEAWSNNIKLPDTVSDIPGVGQLTSVGGKILYTAIRESEAGNRSAHINYLYDPKTDSWSRGEPSPGRIFAGLSAVGDKAYLAGGAGEGGDSKDLDEYDLATGKWKKKSPMPVALAEVSAAECMGRIYIFKSAVHPAPQQLWIYDPSKDP